MCTRVTTSRRQHSKVTKHVHNSFTISDTLFFSARFTNEHEALASTRRLAASIARVDCFVIIRGSGTRIQV
jgi:hypothetical protein